MAKTLPQNFPIPSENLIQSYSYEELASGVAFKDFYFAISTDETSDSTPHWYLVEKALRSAQLEEANDSADQEIDFDTVTFNFQRTVGGKAYLTLDTKALDTSGATTWTFTLKKVDASSVETDLTSGVQYSQSNATTLNNIFLVLPITSDTIVKKGEHLRLTIRIQKAAGQVVFGVDPTGRDGTNITAAGGGTTQSIISVPFRVFS